MAFDHRKSLMKEIEELREGRRLIALCNFDKSEFPPNLGTNTQFGEDIKEPVFRVLKETLSGGQKLDIFLYTRGGSLNAVWPVVSLLREFDPDFELLVPFRAHSSGTLLALAAKRIIMTPLAELSPIDPTTGNAFNPRDEVTKEAALGISVEDLNAYLGFLRKMFGLKSDADIEIPTDLYNLMQPHLMVLTSKVHPLALGNVHRVHMQIKLLASKVLEQHYGEGDHVEKMIDSLATSYYSHHHMINRMEARAILGDDHVEFADPMLSKKLDELLRSYEETFDLRQPFILKRFMGDDPQKEVRLVGGCVESREWGYLNETKLIVRQFPLPPANIQIQLEPGQVAPLVPGMPRKLEPEIISRGWVRNKTPLGVSL